MGKRKLRICFIGLMNKVALTPVKGNAFGISFYSIHMSYISMIDKFLNTKLFLKQVDKLL